MNTLKDLINRLQAIKDSGSFIQLSNFIEELERLDAANVGTDPVPPVPGPPVEAIAAGPNAPAEPGRRAAGCPRRSLPNIDIHDTTVNTEQ